jgi:cell division protease FtsH
MAMSDEEKRATAWHEAGHAILNVLLKHTQPLHKVTIIPRGRALGVHDVAAEGRHVEHAPQAGD